MLRRSLFNKNSKSHELFLITFGDWQGMAELLGRRSIGIKNDLSMWDAISTPGLKVFTEVSAKTHATRTSGSSVAENEIALIRESLDRAADAERKTACTGRGTPHGKFEQVTPAITIRIGILTGDGGVVLFSFAELPLLPERVSDLAIWNSTDIS